MEKKEGFLFFFGALSVLSTLLVICLACLVIHNHTQVENIRIKLTSLEKSCSCLQQPTTRDQDVVEVPQDRTNIDLTQGERLRRQSDPLALLYGTLSNIVDQKLQETLDCSNNETECSLKPGPKGEQGEPGPQGEHGRRGQKGDRGEIGPQGVTGQIGYPGDKGQKGELGAKGDKGSVGSTGIQLVNKDQGQVALHQENCTWIYTDHCGHRCGARTPFTAVCPDGSYVAGLGLRTFHDLGRYDTRIYCCTSS